MSSKNEKPKLVLARPREGGTFTVEDLARMMERLTGRKPTPTEMEAARRILERSRDAH